jgi:hypothetical protein
MSARYPRITDDDIGQITATIDGEQVRSWRYGTDHERRIRMCLAHEFAEGWFQCSIRKTLPAR